MIYDQMHGRRHFFLKKFLLLTNDLENMFGNKHDEQHLLKGVSIYLQNLFGNRVGVFTIQCKRMNTKFKNICINIGLHVFGERCALRHVYKLFISLCEGKV
jgi:hypothetical protein